jgi:opacity protein-like surface antigen
MRSWVTAGAGLAFLTGSALAQTSGTYVTAEGGVVRPSTLDAQSAISQTESLGIGKSYGAAYGYDFGNGFRTEIESLTSNAASDRLSGLPVSGNLSTTRVMLNGLYEFSDGAWRTKPYLGAGVGVVELNARMLGISNNDWIAAYQLRGGVALGFTQKLVGSFEYRWTNGSKPHFSLAGIPTKLEVDRHGFVVGVNYKY